MFSSSLTKHGRVVSTCALLVATASLCSICAHFASGESSANSALGYSLKLYNAINLFRAKHTVPALRWNRTLSEMAESFAVRILTSTDSFDIEDSEGVDFFISHSAARPQASFVAEVWYNESSQYDYSNPVYSPNYLNFTNMIWKSSTAVGIGTYTDTENNYTSVIAKFHPVGNLKGKFRQNVIAKYKKL